MPSFEKTDQTLQILHESLIDFGKIYHTDNLHDFTYLTLPLNHTCSCVFDTHDLQQSAHEYLAREVRIADIKQKAAACIASIWACCPSVIGDTPIRLDASIDIHHDAPPDQKIRIEWSVFFQSRTPFKPLCETKATLFNILSALQAPKNA